MIYEPHSIVVVPFPFTDKDKTKRRPALVLSSLEHQEQTGHITLLMITSAKNSTWYSDYLIKHLATTGLTASSVIRQKIFTIDSRLLLEVIGKLDLEEQIVINRLLLQHIAI